MPSRIALHDGTILASSRALEKHGLSDLEEVLFAGDLLYDGRALDFGEDFDCDVIRKKLKEKGFSQWYAVFYQPRKDRFVGVVDGNKGWIAAYFDLKYVKKQNKHKMHNVDVWIYDKTDDDPSKVMKRVQRLKLLTLYQDR